MKELQNHDRIFRLLAGAKRIARQYRSLTGKPLGVAGEVAEHEAARLLGLQLTPARTAGYDAVRPKDGRRYSIKGRCILPDSKPSQRMGRIDVSKRFDAVLLVVMDARLEAVEIHEASRRAVLKALSAPGSKARNVRGALPVGKFRQIGRKVWP